jgi:hypothetical protein
MSGRNGTPDPTPAISVENEFASVRVERFDAPTGPRLKITDTKSGMSVLLDALELESLAWAEHAQLDPLLDPSRGRWSNGDPDVAP